MSFFQEKKIKSPYSTIVSNLFCQEFSPFILFENKDKKTSQPLPLLTQAARQVVLKNPPQPIEINIKENNLKDIYRINLTTSISFNGCDLVIGQCNPELPFTVNKSSITQNWHFYKAPHSLWPSSFSGKTRNRDFNYFLSPQREKYRLWYIDHKVEKPGIYCFNPEEHTIEKTIVSPANIGDSTYFKLQPLKTSKDGHIQYHNIPELFTIPEQRNKDEYGVSISTTTPFWHGVYSKATRKQKAKHCSVCSPSLKQKTQTSTIQTAVCQCRTYLHENSDTWSLHLVGKTIVSLHTNGSLRLQILDTSLSFNRHLFKPIAQIRNKVGHLEHLIAYMGELNDFQSRWARAYLHSDVSATHYCLKNKQINLSKKNQSWTPYDSKVSIQTLVFRAGIVSLKVPFAHNIVFVQNRSECYIYIRSYYQKKGHMQNPLDARSTIIDLKRYRVTQWDLSEAAVEHYNLFESITAH
ncbi:hypothetical protein [Endozoicomonas sp. Mp262]|uniref:hypothetical protein n=1 Tax=Endozoicomonas sp. Mp262 TaxID=2919499 RepID=UPI0021DB7E95